jgi:hypothetical protein
MFDLKRLKQCKAFIPIYCCTLSFVKWDKLVPLAVYSLANLGQILLLLFMRLYTCLNRFPELAAMSQYFLWRLSSIVLTYQQGSWPTMFQLLVWDCENIQFKCLLKLADRLLHLLCLQCCWWIIHAKSLFPAPIKTMQLPLDCAAWRDEISADNVISLVPWQWYIILVTILIGWQVQICLLTPCSTGPEVW